MPVPPDRPIPWYQGQRASEVWGINTSQHGDAWPPGRWRLHHVGAEHQHQRQWLRWQQSQSQSQ